MGLESLLRHAAYLFTVYADYSYAKRGMVISTALANILFNDRLKMLPGFGWLSFRDVLEAGRCKNVWDWEGDACTGLVVMRWEPDPPPSFGRHVARLTAANTPDFGQWTELTNEQSQRMSHRMLAFVRV